MAITRPEPTADEQAFLAAVIAHPDEDTPRLMYADWLDENAGNLPGRDPTEVRARAEFIRGQIEASRFPPGDPNAKQLRARVVEFAERYGEQWCSVDYCYIGGFTRGFPALASFEQLKHFCVCADELLARYPIQVIYASEFWEDTEEAEKVVTTCSHFSRITGLGSTWRGWGGSRVTKALTNPHFANLRIIDFNAADENGPEVGHGIAAAEHLTNLVVLDLSGNDLGNEGLEALARAKHLQSLRALRLGAADVGENYLGPDGIAALARSTWFPSLTQLVLDCNDIKDEGLEHILKAKWASNLTELNLACTALTEEGLVTLARSHRLTNLRRLDIAANRTTDAVAKAFLSAKGFPYLTELRFNNPEGLTLPSEELQTALRNRFGPATFPDDSFAPTAICVEDKIRWRRQTLSYNRMTYTPPPPAEDCEVI